MSGGMGAPPLIIKLKEATAKINLEGIRQRGLRYPLWFYGSQLNTLLDHVEKGKCL